MFATYTPALKWYETFNTNNPSGKSLHLEIWNIWWIFPSSWSTTQTLGSGSQDFFHLGVDKSAYLANAHSLYTAVARSHVCNSLYSYIS